MDLLFLKLDFNKVFDKELSQYGRAIFYNPNDFEICQRAKDTFKDRLVEWFIKRINGEYVPTQEFVNIIEKDVIRLKEYLAHSISVNGLHTAVPNDIVERIINALSKPDIKQDNPRTEIPT